jgi:dynein heavy chain
VTNKIWCNIEEATELLYAFKGWDAEFSEHLDEYLEIANSNEPFKKDFPGEVGSQFTIFHKLIVTNIIAGDKVIPGLTYLIQSEFGEYYVNFPSFDINSAYEVSNFKTPFIFIISPGVNPCNEIKKIANFGEGM